MVNTGNTKLLKYSTSVLELNISLLYKEWIQYILGVFYHIKMYYIKTTMSDFLFSENKETTCNGREEKTPQIKVPNIADSL